jgi:hypothetical protein
MIDDVTIDDDNDDEEEFDEGSLSRHKSRSTIIFVSVSQFE